MERANRADKSRLDKHLTSDQREKLLKMVGGRK